MAKKKDQLKFSDNSDDKLPKSQLLSKAMKKIQSPVSPELASNLTNIPFWLSTGDDVFDLIASNRKHAGIPGGRLTLLDGLQQSGKSLVCSHLIKSCQQLGGFSIVFDTQNAANQEFMRAIGVDTSDVVVYRGLNKLQTIFSIIEKTLYSLRLQLPTQPILIIIDSITACVTQKDLQNTDYENKGFLAGLRAKMIGQAARKLTPMIASQNVALVITSQVRAKMDLANIYMDPYQASSGGMSLPFYATLQIRLQKKSKLKATVYGVQQVVGVKTKARIDKSRLGPTYRQCEFDVYYDVGIDNYTNWVTTLTKYKVLQGKGTKNIPYVVKYNDEQITIPGKFAECMRTNPEIREKVYDVLADLLILKYKNIQDVQGRQIIEQMDNSRDVESSGDDD